MWFIVWTVKGNYFRLEVAKASVAEPQAVNIQLGIVDKLEVLHENEILNNKIIFNLHFFLI